jgi:hypothetical protein
MNLEHKSSKVLITGQSGTGKSTFWTRYVLGHGAAFKFVFDHEGEISFRLHHRAAFTAGELGVAAASGFCIFDPSRMFAGRLPEAFAFFCRFVFDFSSHLKAYASRGKLFACDEVQQFLTPGAVPAEFATVLECGRRYSLDVVCVAQAPNILHNRLRNQLSEVVAFRALDENALRFLEGVGFQPESVRRLPDGAFIAANLRSGRQVPGRVF